MADTYMIDISEWQSDIDAPTYKKAGYELIICRTYSGYSPDKKMPGRRDYLRGAGLTGIGWYCYLAASKDPADQARAFINTIGTLKSNEWPILDIEEGSGNQTSRAEAFLKVVDQWAGFPGMIYASEGFFSAQLNGCSYWKGRPVWVAAYRNSYSPDPAGEPKCGQILWQYTDRASVPGVSGGVDRNVSRKTVADFMKAARPGGAAPKPPEPVAPPDQSEIGPVVKLDGAIAVFAQRQSGEVLWAYQKGENSGWTGSEPGKPAKWYSLGNPGK